jgi:Flp pilus assembly protein TadG
MSRLIRTLTALWRAERGVVAVEFALIVPTLMVLFFGTYEASNLIRAKMKFDSAAPAVASLVALQTSDTGTLTTDFCTGAADMMAPFSTAGLNVEVASVTNYSGTTKVDWTASCGDLTNPQDPKTLATGLVPNSGDSVIVAQTSYTYTAPVSMVLGKTFTFENVGYARPRSNSTVNYTP